MASKTVKMTQAQAVSEVVNVLCDYIMEYAESFADITPLTGQGMGCRPGQENVERMATALHKLGEFSAAERLRKLCK